ncbi:acyltransferase family protein [Streptomyces fructofermentans]|uniref:acyltransferase family protein n=1 Tax=Streptomyces fructofermentans TaxID=152141 RepID=UPI0037A085B0
MGWLDALRGIAALLVVLDHSSYTFLPEFRREMTPVFNSGRCGIIMFFLVSGYIIPASLERRGCVRTFWVGRVFRLYPLWTAAVTAFLVLGALGLTTVRDFGRQSAATVALAHVTLLQELLGTRNLLVVLWTLSYEMAFYLLVVALFTVGLHQRSAATALVLAALTVMGATVGSALPAAALSGAIGTGPLIVLAAVAMAAAIGCASAGPPTLRRAGGLLGGTLALTLVVFNSMVPIWESLAILAAMFLGTTVHRAENGRTTWLWAAVTAAAVLVCAVVGAYAGDAVVGSPRNGWLTAFLLAVLAFGVGLASRRRRVPRWLTGLGTISYSLFLVHPVLLAVVDTTVGRARHDSPLLEVAFCAVLLPVCVLTQRYIEAPGQRWGRRLARRVRPS